MRRWAPFAVLLVLLAGCSKPAQKAQQTTKPAQSLNADGSVPWADLPLTEADL
jgi:PBP1b-binding outer membrane lipoprotein LpoB